MDNEHYNKTTNLIFQWMHDPVTATPKALYRMLDNAGLLFTKAVEDEAYQAGSENMARRIAKRLWAEADAVTDENKRALLNETALIADDVDAYAKAYPIGIGRDYETPKQGLPDYETLKLSAANVEADLRAYFAQGLTLDTSRPIQASAARITEPATPQGDVPCSCQGISHRIDCLNWELPY